MNFAKNMEYFDVTKPNCSEKQQDLDQMDLVSEVSTVGSLNDLPIVIQCKKKVPKCSMCCHKANEKSPLKDKLGFLPWGSYKNKLDTQIFLSKTLLRISMIIIA